LWLIFTASIIGGLILLFQTTPDQGLKIVSAFYLSVFAFVLSLLTIIGFKIRKYFGQREFVLRFMFLAFRQALWLALLVVISLILSSTGLFTWINAGVLAGAFIFLESYLLTRKPKEYQNE
jgi:hypothetical protein